MAVILALGLAACGSRHTPPAGVTGPLTPPAAAAGRPGTGSAMAPVAVRRAPACSYLSVADVSDILKGPIGKPAGKETAAVSACAYPPLDMTSYQQAQIDIEWRAAATATLEDTMAQTFGGSAEGRQVAHRVPLGDAASYSREGDLRIHAGSALISITLMMRPDSEQKAVALGQLLLERMGYAGTEPTSAPDASSLSAAVPRPDAEGDEVADGIVVGEHCADADASSGVRVAQTAADDSAALIPLKTGLTLAYTWTKGADPEDHECLEQVANVAAGYVDITESCAYANGKRSHNQRRVCRQDLQHSHVYHPSLWENAQAVISPTTLVSLSADALRELKSAGHTHHRLLELYPHPTRLQAIRFETDTTLTVDPAAPKIYTVLVNDKLVQLPVITSTSATGTTEEADDDDVSPIVRQLQAAALSDEPRKEDLHGSGVNAIIATTLDDPRFPLMLDYQVPGKHYRVRFTKITYGAEPDMERKLTAQEPVNVYGIYFDFASDKLRPESGPVLEEIAAIMAKNPAWHLSLMGHTDGVGYDASNLDLSKRRAAEVRRTLIEQYRIGASRLTTGGAGAGEPQDTNTTPEGRARNRRVVLRRET